MTGHTQSARRMHIPSVIFALCLTVTFVGCAVVDSIGDRNANRKKDPYLPAEFLPEFTQIGWVWPCDDVEPLPYVPREGDIIFTSSISPKQTIAYHLIARIGLPHHIMMVVRTSDGELGTFEVGAGGDRRAVIRPICKRLVKHKELYKGSVIAIRQIKRPLSAAESRRLTCFAESQVGKPFTSRRELVAVALSHRSKKDTKTSQKTWFCSELVVQSLQVSGVIRCIEKPKDLAPEDLYHDEQYDLSPIWTEPLDWTPDKTPTQVRPLFDPSRRSGL